jgi:sulfite exporter TauE/SafE
VIAILVSVFIASILGSLHCVGMCGGFVGIATKPSLTIVSNSCGANAVTENRLSVLYNLGRLSTYICLGATVGLIGELINRLFTELHVTWIATVVIVLVLLFAVLNLLQQFGNSFLSKINLPWLASVKKLLGTAESKYSLSKRAFFIGALSTLLPCGWLYANLSIAMTQPGPVEGALVMTAFWLGTLPAMFSISFILNSLSSRMRVTLPRWGAVILVLAAFYSLFLHLKVQNTVIKSSFTLPTDTKNSESHHCH